MREQFCRQYAVEGWNRRVYKVVVEHTGLVVLELVKIDLLAHYEKRASLWKWMEM